MPDAAPQSGHSKPLVIGITGSIAMGKSETAGLFARLGIPVYDSDKAVHALYDRGGGAVAPVAASFPDAVREGRVDRTRLAERVTNDPAAFARLESIVHPLAAAARRAFVARMAEDGAEFVVLDIPLLFETSADREVDVIVVASAPHHVQRERVLARPNMRDETFAAILARQMPDAEKRAKADFVVDTGKGLDHAFDAVKRIVETLRARRTKRT